MENGRRLIAGPVRRWVCAIWRSYALGARWRSRSTKTTVAYQQQLYCFGSAMQPGTQFRHAWKVTCVHCSPWAIPPLTWAAECQRPFFCVFSDPSSVLSPSAAVVVKGPPLPVANPDARSAPEREKPRQSDGALPASGGPEVRSRAFIFLFAQSFVEQIR